MYNLSRHMCQYKVQRKLSILRECFFNYEIGFILEGTMTLRGMKMNMLLTMSVALLLHAYTFAELVYDDESAVDQQDVYSSEESDVQSVDLPVVQTKQRQNVRQNAYKSVNSETPSQVIVNQTASPYVTQDQDQRTSAQSESKSEMLRRERMREELKNEDKLQTRLEELRLKDEEKRVSDIFDGGNKNSEVSPQAIPVEVVQVQPQYQQDEVSMQQSSVTPVSSISSDSKSALSDSMFFIQPKGGIANFTGNKWYEIDPRFSVGVNLGFVISEHYGIEAGYSYSQFDVKMQQNLGFQSAFNNYLSNQYSPYGQYQQNYTKLVMKQNVIDVSFKAFLTPRSYRFRPYIGAGLGWGKSYINYDENTLKWIKQLYGQSAKDYELSQYLGVLSAGFDIQLNESIAVGLGGKYYQVLSSTEESPIYNYGFYNPYYGGSYTPPPGSLGTFDNSEKGLVSGSLKDNSFYSLSLGLTFTF